VGSYVYVVGGRGDAVGSQTSAIVAIDPATGRTWSVGRLPGPLSDEGCAVASGRVTVVGGQGPTGRVSSAVVELDPAPAAKGSG